MCAGEGPSERVLLPKPHVRRKGQKMEQNLADRITIERGIRFNRPNAAYGEIRWQKFIRTPTPQGIDILKNISSTLGASPVTSEFTSLSLSLSLASANSEKEVIKRGDIHIHVSDKFRADGFQRQEKQG